ncbi:hypothetical protein L6164_024867 [Bauhinia variegata]|uniref:Uncharacterized protein n=1 Tax=Bauhinia variegata TaxID=167791 RepID=A0ACB9LZ44_BAUVA|nr:hypothetical protein L6164_024867 [Bauhinia variegata]
MGAVCSAGMDKKNAQPGGDTLELKLKKENNIANWKGDSSTDYNRKKQKKRDSSDIQSSFNESTPSQTGERKSSFVRRAGERAVEVLDTLGSSISKLNADNGFNTGMVSKGKKVSILAFEVANTITKAEMLFQSLSEENIKFLRKEILQSEGVQRLVSTDMKELLSLAEADKREECSIFSREVARFGDLCKDPQWHNLNRYFLRLDSDIFGGKQLREETERTIKELITLAQDTAELYHELNALERFEQDYQQKVKEMESLNLPLKGESLTIFQSELKHQRKLVRSLKKKSLWSRNLEEIVEKLVEIVTYIHQAIYEFIGDYGTLAAVPKYSKGPQRLGEAGLALHYANIINQMNVIASRRTSLPPNMRDALYHGLPNNIKSALPSKLQTIAVKEPSLTEVKSEMDKTLQWLVPVATNTTKAHQSFGWIGEWANTSNDFGNNTDKESNLIRLQTLHYADKQKTDIYILELLARLHHLISFARYRQQPLKPKPTGSPTKGLSKMRQFVSPDSSSKTLSIEDRRLLEDVIRRRRTPGVSKSEDFAAGKKREARGWSSSKSAGSSPDREIGMSMIPRFQHQSFDILDIMDGLRY